MWCEGMWCEAITVSNFASCDVKSFCFQVQFARGHPSLCSCDTCKPTLCSSCSVLLETHRRSCPDLIKSITVVEPNRPVSLSSFTELLLDLLDSDLFWSKKADMM